MAKEETKAVATQEPKGLSLEDLLKKQLPAIERALPRVGALDAQRFVRIALTTIRKNPKLLACTGHSLLASVMESAQLGLSLDGSLGEAYLVPYGTTAVMITGYKGKQKLARRSGAVATIEARPVFVDDFFEVEYGSNAHLTHRPNPWGKRAQADVVGFYARSVLVGPDGKPYEQWETMSVAEVEHIRAKSRAKNDGPWVSDWVEMGRKTVFHRAAKWLPLGTDEQRVFKREEQLDSGTYDPADDAALVTPEEPEPADSREPVRVQAPSQDAEPASMGATASVRVNEDDASRDDAKEEWLAVCADLAKQSGVQFDEKKARKLDLAGLKQYAKTLGYKED